MTLQQTQGEVLTFCLHLIFDLVNRLFTHPVTVQAKSCVGGLF